MTQEIIFSEERGSWNLFVDNEWYLEGSYEECEEAMFNNEYCEEESEWEEWEEYDYDCNCHCDTYGVCGGLTCSNYFICHAERSAGCRAGLSLPCQWIAGFFCLQMSSVFVIIFSYNKKVDLFFHCDIMYSR